MSRYRRIDHDRSIASADCSDRHEQVNAEGYWVERAPAARRNRLALASAIFIIVAGLSAIFVPMFYPYTYAEQDYNAMTQRPTLGSTRWAPISSAGIFSSG